MINLYWWREEPNFGDAASAYIVSKLFGDIKWCKPQISLRNEFLSLLRCIKHTRKYSFPNLTGYVYPWKKGLFSIGSILDFSNHKTIVWGSGFREYESKFSGGKVYAVRGKLSLDKIPKSARVGEVALGDPAILLPLVYHPIKTVQYEVSIIPHFVEYDFFSEKYGEQYNIIDVRSNDVETVINKIVASKYILSSSLHGVIIAHAYGVPALWIKHGWINSSDFKFKDYFSAVGIEQYNGFTNLSLIFSSIEAVKQLFEEYRQLAKIEDIVVLQNALINSFPYDYFHVKPLSKSII